MNWHLRPSFAASPDNADTSNCTEQRRIHSADKGYALIIRCISMLQVQTLHLRPLGPSSELPARQYTIACTASKTFIKASLPSLVNCPNKHGLTSIHHCCHLQWWKRKKLKSVLCVRVSSTLRRVSSCCFSHFPIIPNRHFHRPPRARVMRPGDSASDVCPGRLYFRKHMQNNTRKRTGCTADKTAARQNRHP